MRQKVERINDYDISQINSSRCTLNLFCILARPNQMFPAMLAYRETYLEIKSALQETRHRKQRLLYFISLIDRIEGENMRPTSSRGSALETIEEYNFVPSISERSREIAKKINRDPLYRKRGDSQVEVPPQPVRPLQPSLNPVSREIAEKISREFGSVDAYLDTRRKELLLSRMHENIRSEEKEMRECTFRPVVHERPSVQEKRSRTKGQPIEEVVAGIDSFVRRQEKARELKALAVLANRPGTGDVYTGAPTKIMEFKFSSIRGDNVTSRE